MRTISIILGDNDFTLILVEMCKTLFRIHQTNTITSKERVEELVREGLWFHYVGFSRWYENHDKARLDSLKDYFKDFKVLIDEEAEFDIYNNDHDGGAAYVLLGVGQVKSY